MKYRFRTKPYAHQRAGVQAALAHFKRGLGYGLFFEPRTGKTKTTVDIAAAVHYTAGTRKVLVIAPNRVLGVWVKEFAMHSPIAAQVVVWDAKARKSPIPARSGDIQVLVVNYEAFGVQPPRTKSGRRSTAGGRMKYRALLRKWLRDDPNALIVCDESHRLKSPSGAASNLIVSMRDDFRFHLLLTGTPITKAKRAADIYMQWQLINPQRFARWGATYDDFRNHVGKWSMLDGVPIWRRPNERGMADLKRGIHMDSMVVRRDECFDLPKRLPDRIIPIKLDRATAKAYDEMAEEMVTELENGDIAEAFIPITVILRLMQITSGFVGIPEPHPTNPDKRISRPVRIGRDKERALRELLIEEVLERDEKVVLCGRFKPDLNTAQRLCTGLDIPWWSVRGGATRSATDDALEAFKRADGPAAMVVQPSAGGVGIDMSTASHMIWFSLVNSWVDWTQMRDRIALADRANQHTLLIASGTIDELVYQGLQHDTDVAHAILTRPRSILRGS